MYLLSLRLAPSPWVGTRSSLTAQYTVPSVSTQTVTPRRVGFFACSCAPPRAEHAGPSVWCTMMLRHGWAFATSPHGASQTMLRPGISGVPDPRAMVARSSVAADAGAIQAMAQSAVSSGRKSMRLGSREGPYVARSRTLAQDKIRHRRDDFGRRRRGVKNRMTVLAVPLGDVKRLICGGHQPVRERTDLPGPLCDPDR